MTVFKKEKSLIKKERNERRRRRIDIARARVRFFFFVFTEQAAPPARLHYNIHKLGLKHPDVGGT